ncbi:hypothetical protein Hanom_Chr05g00429211 [Helianthus anomalus]
MYCVTFKLLCIFELYGPRLGEGSGSLVIEFITHKHQSSSAMSSTIFLSLTTFFSGGGHHSSPHPTISPNQQFHSQNQTIMR